MPYEEHFVAETDGDPKTAYEDTQEHGRYELGVVAETKLDASLPDKAENSQASLEGPTNG